MNSIQLDGKKIVITGAAGFIGSNLCIRLLQEFSGLTLIGFDNMNDYNPLELKEWRLSEIKRIADKYSGGWDFVKGDIVDKDAVDSLFSNNQFDIVVNLAAQAGVRYSIDNPYAYLNSNISGFLNILEACRHDDNLKHLVFASSSSVYGCDAKVPFSIDDKADNPVSLYAATKRSNELMAHAYSKLYNISSTGLRFFTVYGPAGRTDMAYFCFANKLVKGEKIKVFNYGNSERDFTYIDDIVEGIMKVMASPPDKKNGEDGLPIPPYSLYNIGKGSPENLLDFIDILKQELVRAGVLPENYDLESHMEKIPMQPGDVPVTYADTSALERDFNYRPSTTLREGLRKFAEWYKDFYTGKRGL